MSFDHCPDFPVAFWRQGLFVSRCISHQTAREFDCCMLQTRIRNQNEKRDRKPNAGELGPKFASKCTALLLSRGLGGCTSAARGINWRVFLKGLFVPSLRVLLYSTSDSMMWVDGKTKWLWEGKEKRNASQVKLYFNILEWHRDKLLWRKREIMQQRCFH